MLLFGFLFTLLIGKLKTHTVSLKNFISVEHSGYSRLIIFFYWFIFLQISGFIFIPNDAWLTAVLTPNTLMPAEKCIRPTPGHEAKKDGLICHLFSWPVKNKKTDVLPAFNSSSCDKNICSLSSDSMDE
jgi:hypothetical protein